jgi:hypothetical protein
MKKLLIIFATALSGCDNSHHKYTIKIERCNGNNDTLTYTGSKPIFDIVNGQKFLYASEGMCFTDACGFMTLNVE